MTQNPFGLTFKNILVTGATSGIGKSTAIECSNLGANVFALGRNAQRMQETMEKLEVGQHVSLLADITNSGELEKILDTLPSLDGIVHSAGIVKTVPFQFINQSDFYSLFETNFFAATFLTQYLLKKKKLNRKCSIVFISSISGNLCSFPGNSMYSATKGAINGLIKGMALELASKEIRVNSVQPGMIATDLLKEGVISEDQIREDMQKYPLKRYGKPEEVAYAVIYLLSDASQWVTGSNLLIDGGYTLI